MGILVKNGNFGQKWEFWSKMGILVKNGNFGQKWKFQKFCSQYFEPIFCPKFEISVNMEISKIL